MSETDGTRPAPPDADRDLVGKAETTGVLLLRMLRENRLAAASAVLILLFFLAAVLAPVLAPWDPNEMDLANSLAAPCAQHPLGTDDAGRDVLSRLLFGSRVSLAVGVVPTLVATVVGAVLGALSGYFGGWVDALVMRLCDVMLAFPSILLVMVIMYTLGDGLANVFLALSITGWASVARVVRSECLRLKASEFMEAARVIGVSNVSCIFRHILPNCLPVLIVLFTLQVPSSILSESGLSFVGLGVRPPDASWGQMVNDGRQFLYLAPWLSLSPSVCIMVIVLALNFLGDGLRDALDPNMRNL